MTWRVGVLFSQTGVTAAIERSQLNGTLLAVDEINKAGGVLGRPIEPNIYDPASNPKQFRALAERLLTADRVRLIFGCYMSSTRKAVLPVVEAFRGLLFYPTLYEGFEYSLHCIYTGAAPNQNSLQLAKYLLQHYGNRFLLIGSNYIYPYESNRVMADFISQSKGKVLDELYVPLDAQAKDFNKAISKIAALKPDVVFSTVVGQSTAVFYEAYRRAGFDPNKMPIASLTTSEAEVAEMSPEAAEGHITAAPFFEALATAAARRFISAYKLRRGRVRLADLHGLELLDQHGRVGGRRRPRFDPWRLPRRDHHQHAHRDGQRDQRLRRSLESDHWTDFRADRAFSAARARWVRTRSRRPLRQPLQRFALEDGRWSAGQGNPAGGIGHAHARSLDH